MARTLPQRIRQHQVWTDLNSLDQALTDAEQLLADADPEVASVHASLLALAKHTCGVLKSINPVLVPETQLDVTDRSIQAISNSVTAAVQGKDAAQLVTAWSHADQLLTALAMLPVVKSRHDATGMAEAMAHFHQHTGELLDDLQKREDALHDELAELDERRAELESENSSQKGLLANAISNFETQFAADQEVRSTEYTAALDASKASLDAASEQATDFYKQDEDLHIEQMKEFQTKFDELKDALDTTAKDTADAHADQAAETIANMEEQLAKAKSLVEMIGEVTMTGHYQKNAIEQRNSADRWRLATVAVSGLAIASAIVMTTIGLFYRNDRDWTDYANHFSVTIALTALAAFLGAQSLRHRRREETYRSLELELATLDPFLSSMSDDERHRIKALLAMRYFAGIDPDAVGFEDPTSSA